MGQRAMTVSGEQLTAHEVPKRADPKIIILMYHNLVYGRTGNEYNRDIYNFEHDLAFIRDRFKIIDFYDLEEIKKGKAQLENDAAIITFDDGDLSMYAITYPLLMEYNIKATFFIVSSFVGEIGYMNWAQIREVAQYRSSTGERLFTIGSHSVNHVYLGNVDAAARRMELADSQRTIEKNIGRAVDIFALPFGSGAGNPELIEEARRFGYKAIRTSDIRAVAPRDLDLMRLPGIYIDNRGTDKTMKDIWALVGH